MKKFSKVLVCFVVILAMFGVCAFAEEPTAPTETPTESENATPEVNAPTEEETPTESEETGENDLTSWWRETFSGASLATIATAILSAITLILATTSSVKGLKGMVMAIGNLLAGKATKEDVSGVIDNVKTEILDKYEEKNNAIMKDYNELKEKNDLVTTLLTVVFIHLNLPQSVKGEMMNIITGTKEVTGDLSEKIEQIENSIKATEESTPKEETPALDELEKEEENKVMRLE